MTWICSRFAGVTTRRFGVGSCARGAMNIRIPIEGRDLGLLAGGRLIQSQAPDSGLASQRVSVRDSNLCPNPG